ncbi:MAG: SMP-30/gluconolactonase/LRE family protein [Coriobacteriales bacterium]|nr:SMP-30/gluconolactonase/LRE family protein [Coriobacteriales bacterium]
MSYKQSPKVKYPDDYLVSPDAEWELVAHADDCIVLEGINFVGDDLWLLDTGRGRILKVEGDRVVVALQCEKGMPNGMRPLDDHTILVADRILGLCTYDTITGEYEVRCTGLPDAPFIHIDDLVLDGRGGAYITDPGGSNYTNPFGRVFYVRYGDGSYECEEFLNGIAFPNGITLSPDGIFVYVAEFSSNTIICAPSKLYDDDKEAPYAFARLVGGIGPDGLITDKEGNIYAAHLHAGEVVAFDKKGWPIAEIRLPECAGVVNTNLCIHDGYLYTCELEKGDVWRIPIKAEQHQLS